MKTMRRFILLLVSMFSFAHAGNKTDDSCCIMNVFIHGTISVRIDPVSIYDICKCAVDNKLKLSKEEMYDKFVSLLKKNSIEKTDMCGGMGFINIDDSASDLTKQTVHAYESTYNDANPGHTHELRHYMFNWNGRLHKPSREQAAKDLYGHLVAESKRLEKEIKKPVKIHLLAHSHGCNVVLELIPVEQQEKKNLRVEKAIMFAGPVQKETKQYIPHLADVFDSYYACFSRADMIQVCDCVSTKGLFSRRIFSGVTLPDNLRQIEIKAGKYSPSHMEFWSWRTDFWLAKSRYRKKLPVCPFPLMVFAPWITRLADEHTWNNEKRLNTVVLEKDSCAIGSGDAMILHAMKLPKVEIAA